MTKVLSGREKRIIRISVILSILFFLAFALLRNSYARGNHITTATLFYETVYDSAVAEGIVIRSDTVIPKSETGNALMLVKDGEKVAKTDRLAVSFLSRSALLNYANAVSMQERADAWQQALDQDPSMLNLSTVNASIYDTLLSLGKNAADGVADPNRGNALLKDMITRCHILNEEKDLRDEVKAMKSKAASGIASAGTPSGIFSPVAGYFSYAADGLETELTMKNAEKLSGEQIRQYLIGEEKKDTSGYLGRVASGFQWYYAALTDASREAELLTDRTYLLNFSSFSADGVLVRTEHLEDGQLYCLFRVSDQIEKAVSDRRLDAEIVFKSNSGYQVPKSSVRIEKDEAGHTIQGVYVIRGRRCVFMQIDILLAKENYYIVRADLKDNSGLYLNDTLVLSGRGLYDGMIIN